uniref:Ig-like domain-containing protein n=1 Tax=Cyprinodon variegatus TaxID=28743 RepID=A0A3Q2DGB5_CYPVA
FKSVFCFLYFLKLLGFCKNDKAKPPKVSLYSVAPELQQEGKQPLLCVASGMFPTDVQFSWKRKKAGSQEEPLPDEEQLEIKESDRIASLRLVDRDPDSPYNYTCNVKHELKTEDLEPIGNEYSNADLYSLTLKSIH